MKFRACLRTSESGRPRPSFTMQISKTSKWLWCKPKLRSENLRDRAIGSFLTSSLLLWASPFTSQQASLMNQPFIYLYPSESPSVDSTQEPSCGVIFFFMSKLSLKCSSVSWRGIIWPHCHPADPWSSDLISWRQAWVQIPAFISSVIIGQWHILLLCLKCPLQNSHWCLSCHSNTSETWDPHNWISAVFIGMD